MKGNIKVLEGLLGRMIWCLSLIFPLCFFLDCCQAQNSADICFDSACVSVEIADNDNSRTKGLMFRKELAEKSGMLFVFPVEDIHGFWMKNTLIPLDMIWLDKEMKVVHIESAVQPCKTADCPAYIPAQPASYVLEVNAGFCLRFKIKTGDKAVLKP